MTNDSLWSKQASEKLYKQFIYTANYDSLTGSWSKKILTRGWEEYMGKRDCLGIYLPVNIYTDRNKVKKGLLFFLSDSIDHSHHKDNVIPRENFPYSSYLFATSANKNLELVTALSLSTVENRAKANAILEKNKIMRLLWRFTGRRNLLPQILSVDEITEANNREKTINAVRKLDEGGLSEETTDPFVILWHAYKNKISREKSPDQIEADRKFLQIYDGRLIQTEEKQWILMKLLPNWLWNDPR